MSVATTNLLTKAAVLEGLPAHPAVAAILAWKPEALADAKFDRGELTLTIAAADICAAARIVQAAGYNFFEDLTAVDWFGSLPAARSSGRSQPSGRVDHLRLAFGKLLRARGL